MVGVHRHMLPLFFQGDGEGALASVRGHTTSCLPEYGVALLPPTPPCPDQAEANSSLVMVSALGGAAEELGRGSTGYRPLSRQNVSPRSQMCGCSLCPLHYPRTMPHACGQERELIVMYPCLHPQVHVRWDAAPAPVSTVGTVT